MMMTTSPWLERRVKPFNSLFKSIVSIVLLLAVFQVRGVAGACTLPSDIRGTWDRNRDSQSLTFTSTTIDGFELKYLANFLPEFYCHTQSGNKYILSSDFTTSGSIPYRYLVCWQLEKVTGSAYILYELTNDSPKTNIIPVEPGIGQVQSESVLVSSVCDVTTDYFTVLIKQGATSDDVSTQCPSSLFANFEYTQCTGSSVSFCPGRVTATADYSSCPAIFNSAGGVLSCMGHQEASAEAYTYVNLYKHDAGNGVTCVRLDSDDNGDVAAKYYTGDCSTAGGSSTDLDMTPTKTCPLGGSSDDNTGLIVIVVVVSVGVSGFLLVGVIFYVKKEKTTGKVTAIGNMVSVNTTNSMTVTPSEAPVDTMSGGQNGTTANGTLANGTPGNETLGNGTLGNGTPANCPPQSNYAPTDPEKGEDPFPSPSRTPRLPPLPNAGTSGEPLRG